MKKGDSYYFTGFLYKPEGSEYIHIRVSKIKPIDWLND